MPASRLGRVALFVLVPALLALTLMSYLSMVDHIEHDSRFCGRCHATRNQYLLWAESAHKDITCQECHQINAESAAGMMQAFVLQGMPADGSAPRPKIHSPEVSDLTCERCHRTAQKDWPQIGNSIGHRVHLKDRQVGCKQCHGRSIHRFGAAVEACGECHKQQVDPNADMGKLHCNACHDFLNKDQSLIPTRRVCRECHVARGVSAPDFPTNAHMAGLECGACHRPHVKSRPDRGTCLSCHGAIDRHGLHSHEEHGNCADCHPSHDWRVKQEHCQACHDDPPEHCAKSTQVCWSCHKMTRKGR